MNGCYFTKLAMDDPQWTERIVGAENMKYMDLCLFKNSTGNLTVLLPEAQKKDFQDIQSLIKGFDIDIESLNITGQEPPSMKFYHDEILHKLKTYESSDFTENIEDGPETQISAVNKIVKCAKNEFEVNLKNCKIGPVSTLEDAVDYKNNENYCLVPSLFKWKEIDSR